VAYQNIIEHHALIWDFSGMSKFYLLVKNYRITFIGVNSIKYTLFPIVLN